MKLMIIRHADPDYSIDSLTPTGWKEAELLSEYLCRLDITAFYVSPLGRAKDTASLTLKKMNRTATECDWLQEFAPRIYRPDRAEQISAEPAVPISGGRTTILSADGTSANSSESRIPDPAKDAPRLSCVWDWLPSDWTKEPRYYDKNLWYTTDVMAAANVGNAFLQVCGGLDHLLASHGYVREQGYYRAVTPNRNTIVLFCHFGLECVLLAHLFGCPR